MKVNIFIIFLFLIRVIPVLSQTDNLQNNKDASDVPKIAFTETEYDFGTIQSGGNAIHYFVFSNTGRVPLFILNVRTTCGNSLYSSTLMTRNWQQNIAFR
jgi:hypothetical protein